MASAAEQFRREVLEQEPRTAVFDCDGTLWALDSGQGFMEWTLADRLVSPEREAWIRERYRLYEAGSVDESTICGEMVQLYAGLPESRIRESAEAYVQTYVQPEIFAELAALVGDLNAAGVELWAVSSTNRWVVEAGVWDGGRSAFQIPPRRILAAEVALRYGVGNEAFLSDELLSVPSDDGKAEALRDAGLGQPDVVFGNSMHDAAMLEIARKAFPVNARPDLEELARRKGWASFSPCMPARRGNVADRQGSSGFHRAAR